MIVPIEHYLILSALLFAIGAGGVIISRNLIIIFMSIELMLNAANLSIIAFSLMHNLMDGHVLVFIVMTVAAAKPTPLNIPECKRPPLLDGKLEDRAWRHAGKITKLYQINSNTPAPETTLWLVRHKMWLYISAHCRNPQMANFKPLTHNHDGPVSKDDSLEIFIRPTPTPDKKDYYYHFILNFANVGKEQRCNITGLREPGWNPPWRTATQQQNDGWTAEIAIPLFALESNDLSEMQINLCRNLTTMTEQSQGDEKNERRVLWHTLLPDSTGGFHDFANFRAVGGLSKFNPEAGPFAPQVVAASVTGTRQDAGKNVYDLKVSLDIATPVNGTVLLKVLEDLGKGATEPVEAKIGLTQKGKF